jgi:hypothetical protein
MLDLHFAATGIGAVLAPEARPLDRAAQVFLGGAPPSPALLEAAGPGG